MTTQQYNTDLKPKKNYIIIIILLILVGGAFVYYFRNDLPFLKNFINNETIHIDRIKQENNISSDVYFTGNFSNTGVDINGDGLSDVLRAGVEINVNKSGAFGFSAKLNSKDKKMITFVSKDIVLETGIDTLFFDFDGIDIRESGIDGPYNVSILLLNRFGDEINYTDFITADYKASIFKMRDASFTDQYSVLREDLNNDNKYDLLIFNIGVNINTSGNYQIQGSLLDKNGDAIDVVTNSVYLEKNNSEVQLKFDGKRINDRKINGPYHLKYLAITKEALIDFRLDADSTSNYKYIEFQSY